MHLDEKTISSEKIFEGRVIKLERDTVLLENGEQATREVVLHPGGVCVVPLTPENEVYVVRQFRYPHRRVFLEIPAGKLEIGEEHRSA
ncbi:MAG: ADP-ribose pyrophosphatase, partial [Oscillospiraceae bacterium]